MTENDIIQCPQVIYFRSAHEVGEPDSESLFNLPFHDFIIILLVGANKCDGVFLLDISSRLEADITENVLHHRKRVGWHSTLNALKRQKNMLVRGSQVSTLRRSSFSTYVSYRNI